MTTARANTLVEKQQKHQAIIDAAAQLFQQDLSLATVAKIAKHSGQAKGTVYLYFSSKETIYLTLLQQHYDIWINQLKKNLETTQSLSKFLQCFIKYPLEDKLFFPLASLSCAVFEPACDVDIKNNYYQWLNDNFNQLSIQFSQQFPRIEQQDALSLINDSHAQLLGLWQQHHRHGETHLTIKAKAALARLWKGFFTL